MPNTGHYDILYGPGVALAGMVEIRTRANDGATQTFWIDSKGFVDFAKDAQRVADVIRLDLAEQMEDEG